MKLAVSRGIQSRTHTHSQRPVYGGCCELNAISLPPMLFCSSSSSREYNGDQSGHSTRAPYNHSYKTLRTQQETQSLIMIALWVSKSIIMSHDRSRNPQPPSILIAAFLRSSTSFNFTFASSRSAAMTRSFSGIADDVQLWLR